MRLLTALLLLALASPSAGAQGTCAPGQATARLDATGVSAPLSTDGSLFQAGGGPYYEVPRGGSVSAIFSASLWVGGLVDGELRVAASEYGGREFWPGPLGSTPPADCTPFDRIWVVSQTDIDAYDQTGTATPDLADWPAGLGAPVVNGDGDPDTYDLAAGDRPDLAGAAQTAWWVMNDAGNVHASSGTPPIGLEARVQAFAYAAGGSVPAYAEQATFYEYTLVYRGPGTVEQTYASLWLDPDLGDAGDDYIGSAPELGMAFAYNATDTDADYGADPPAVGVVGVDGYQRALADVSPAQPFFGPEAGPVGGPSPLSGMTDARLGFDGPPMVIGERAYNVQRARDFTGERILYGFGGGPESGTVPTGFLFSDAPPAFWSERDVSPDPGPQPTLSGDRRQLVSFGPFDLATGDAAVVRFGILWARAPGGGALGSLAALRADALDLIGGELREPEAISNGSLNSVGTETRPGETAEIQVPYQSLGAAPLVITLGPGPDALSQSVIQPATFTLDPHTFGAVRVTADPGDLPPGDYALTMIKRTSDRNQPVGVLPVIVAVLPPLAAEAAPDAALVLLPTAPNPARGVTRVRYRTRRPGAVRLSLSDAVGREVLVLETRDASAGEHTALVDTRRLPPGVYALRLESGAERVVRRLTVVR